MLTRCRALTTAATALVTVLALACDEASPEGATTEDVEARGGSGQGGPVLNTSTLFTSSVSAVDTRGLVLDGVRLVSVERWKPLTGYTPIDADTLGVDHGTLFAQVNGVDIEGLDFLHSRWTFKVDGQNVQAELKVVETAAAAGLYVPESSYTLRMLDPVRLVYTFTWTEHDKEITTCKPDAVGGARTVIYGDIVVDHDLGDISARANTMYFGCISGAVGKAALWGYAPDSPALVSIPLDAFESAVRSVRADYCADGFSYTTDAIPVEPRDRWGINDHSLGMATEAVWQQGGGALCVQRIRSTGATLLAPHECPDGRTIPLCGKSDVILENRWGNDWGILWTKI